MATILVVDDRPLNRQFLTTLLGYAGHRTVEAEDGLEALEKARLEPPDAAIVDIVMPSMDGYALVRQLRSEPGLAATPVIFYTATYLESAARKLAESVGVSYVLTKPSDPEVILRTVTEALGLKDAGPPAPPLPPPPPDDALRLLTVDLSSKLQDVVPRLTALIDLGLQLSMDRDLDRLLQRVCDGARHIIGARFAAVGIFGDDGHTIHCTYHSGDPGGTPAPAGASVEASACERLVVPAAGGVIEQIVAGRHPVRSPDIRPYPPGACPGCSPGREQNCAFLGVPLASAGTFYGVLYLIGKDESDEFSEEDQQVAVTLAAQAGTRYENARLYHELQEHTSRLQTEIDERARLEAELHRRMEELAEGNRRKDEFLAMLAHELRNPLAGIASASALLDRMLAGDPAALTASPREVIRRQADQLARMVDDLLDASRVTRGVIELRKECVDLAAVVRQAEAVVRPVMEARGHRFLVSLPAEATPLNADPARLQQVVVNLLNNAAKYTEPGGCISLTTERRNGQVALRVHDTGIGIAPDLLPHVFDLFTQGSRSLARTEGGLGIGLAVARALVELHGGSIEAHSEGPGQGSDFVVRLPIDGCSPRGGQGAAPPPEPGPLKAAKRILVVDDNADAAEMLAMTLEIDGHEVVAAHSGPAALEMAVGYQPNVVLLDLGMPGMDGYEVAARLRQEPTLAGTLLVALTGYGQAEDRERTRRAGFDHHLVKPVDMEAVRRLLSGAPGGPDHRAKTRQEPPPAPANTRPRHGIRQPRYGPSTRKRE